jgi:hypothetical protein
MYPADPAGYTCLMRETITITRTSGQTLIEGVTASGVRDTTDYEDLMRRALAADSKSKFDTYPGTD